MNERPLETSQAWDEFLKTVERRALLMARVATGFQDEALDIVQDAMLSLVKKYRDKPVAELKPLFYRILQNRIRDWYRRQTVRRRWQFWGSLRPDDEGAFFDPINNLPAPDSDDPAGILIRDEAMAALDAGLRKLPLRQQQTFLLRAWEGLSVSETAIAMKCSVGTVKVQYFRALHTLREDLEDHWP
jgi:RNA polymerase sigma-70 factor (ECF subfamily)